MIDMLIAEWDARLSFIIGAGAVAATVALRVAPRLLYGREFGVDTWYYLTYARRLREQRCWPVTLPYYLLDQPEQIYPPGLPWLLSWLPTRILERSHWWMSAAIDAMHCAVLCGVVWVVSQAWPAVAAAGLLFATSPVLVSQATELNARPPGTFLFSVFMLSLWGMEQHPAWVTTGAALLTGMAVLWTHKMTTQQMVVALAASTLVHRDPRALLVGIGMVGVSLLFSRGWFMEMLRGHRDIVRFWRTRLPLLGAHQVYDSPLYANVEKAKRKRGVTGLRASRLHRLLAQLHLAVIAGLVVWIGFAGLFQGLSLPSFCLRWAIIVYATVFLTTWVPGLKQFGEGFKYLRYGVFPWSLALGLWTSQQAGWWSWGLLGILGGVQLLIVSRLLRAQRHNFLAAVDADTRAVLEELARQPDDGVLALPLSRCEAIAYFCRKQVLWGAHGTQWDQVESVFPVLRRPLERLLEDHRLHWLWVDTRYVDVDDLRLPSSGLTPWMQRGSVRLFHYAPQDIPSPARDADRVCVR